MEKITKTFTITLIFCWAVLQTVSAQTEYKLDSIQQFQYDDILASLQLTQRTHCTYDNGGTKPTEYLYLKKELGTWDNDYRFKYTYNSDNNYLTEIHQDWDAVNLLWLDISKGDYEYDAFQNNTVLTYYSYDGTSWNFANRITSEFNVNNKVTSQLFELVDPMTMTTYKNRSLYTFDVNGNNILIEQQNWSSASGIWENSQKTEMAYNGNLIIQQDSYTWTGGPDWPVTPQSRQIYSYTSNDIYNVIIQIDSGGGLINSTKNFYTYDAGKLLEFETKSWINNDWKEYTKLTVTYDGNGNPSEQYSYNWDDSANAYTMKMKYIYFTSEADPFVLGTSSQELLLTKIYPNPFQNELNISLKSVLESDGVLQMFDLHGKEISKTELRQGIKSIKLNNPNLSKGLYFIQITSGGEKSVLKAIKQ